MIAFFLKCIIKQSIAIILFLLQCRINQLFCWFVFPDKKELMVPVAYLPYNEINTDLCG